MNSKIGVALTVIGIVSILMLVLAPITANQTFGYVRYGRHMAYGPHGFAYGKHMAYGPHGFAYGKHMAYGPHGFAYGKHMAYGPHGFAYGKHVVYGHGHACVKKVYRGPHGVSKRVVCR